MCFSQPGSLAFGLLGLATGAFLKSRGHPSRSYGLFWYFAAMEFIQFGAYSVVDQCDNPWNKFFTFAAYLHVMFQNIPVNRFFLCPEFGVHPDVTKLVVRMCVLGGAMGFLVKLPWPVWLGASEGLLDGLAKAVPEFYSFSTAGTPDSCMYESMCGPKVCTFSTSNHIAWMLPILPPSYYLPNAFLHFFFFFFPTVFMANASAKLTMLAAFITGPLLTQMLAAQHMATYKFEWPATWCYMSVGQCFVAIAVEAYDMLAKRSQAQPAAHTNGAAILDVASNGNGVCAPDTVAYALPDTPGKTSKKKL